jgi:transposase
MSLNDILNLRQFNALSVCVEHGEVLIHGELQETDKTCPACGKEAQKPHQYYEKRVRHLAFANQPTYLVFERKDWICACGKVFLERLSFQDLRAKCTTAYEEWIYQQVAKQDISAVAAQEGLSWDIVEGIFFKGRQKQAGAFTQSGRWFEPNLAY